jgi:hypothetical protein
MAERKKPASEDLPSNVRDETAKPSEPAERDPAEELEESSEARRHKDSPQRSAASRVQPDRPDPRPKTPHPKKPPPKPTPTPDDFVEEGGFTVGAMPWVLVILGAALIAGGLQLWTQDDPTRVSAQITRVTSKTTAPGDDEKGGTTTTDSTEKVVSVTNLHADDAFQQAVLRGVAQPRQRVYGSGKTTGVVVAPPAGTAGPRLRASGAAATGASGATGATGATGPSGEQGTTSPGGPTGKTGPTGTAGVASASAPAVEPSKRSESLTLSLVFLGALFIVGGAFYSRVTSLEAGPSGIKISVKALRHLKKGVLEAAAAARAAGQDYAPSTLLDALEEALARANAAATVFAEGPAVVTAARTPIRKPTPITRKGKKVVIAPEHLEELGREAFNSTLAGNPDFE